MWPAVGEGEDAYRSLEAAAERLEKRLRRYKRRLKDHHNAKHAEEPLIAPSFVLADIDDEEETEASADASSLVVAEQATSIRTQTVGMAAMALDLSEAPVIVFRNAANGRMNIVYRRTDGNIGWIDPPVLENN